MTELITRLRAMRAELADTMASESAADRCVYSWLPLLAQVETAIRAIEAIEGEREDCARGTPMLRSRPAGLERRLTGGEQTSWRGAENFGS